MPALEWLDLASQQMKLTELFMRLDHGSLSMRNLIFQHGHKPGEPRKPGKVARIERDK